MSQTKVFTSKVSREDLDVMIDLLYDKYKMIHGDYKLLCHLLRAEFKVVLSERDIWLHFEPDIETEELDAVIQYKNLGFY